MAETYPCTSASEWRFIAYGTKACGGPVGYMPYNTKIDTVLFKQKVMKFTAEQKEYNVKFGLVSDCSVPAAPKGIECQEGKPKFTY
ncbi:hypothetical protein [Pedobacter sp. MW01-1-1]|uniref:hypothetical protein n=1 Tax=Pedobacter sp. MW01-1-1 TaxID=3383027 RepID=UPI003FEDC0E1